MGSPDYAAELSLDCRSRDPTMLDLVFGLFERCCMGMRQEGGMVADKRGEDWGGVSLQLPYSQRQKTTSKKTLCSLSM